MRTNLHAMFGSTGDPKPCEDPWGAGITVYVKPQGNPDYQGWLAERQKQNPMIRAMLRESLRVQFRTGASQRRAPKTDEDRAALRKLEEEQAAEALRAAAERLEISDEQLDTLLEDVSEGIARHLLAGWEGLQNDAGEAVEFSVDNALELFRDRTFLPSTDESGAEVPFGGQHLGRAIQSWIAECAQSLDVMRKEVVRRETEDFAPPSGGA